MRQAKKSRQGFDQRAKGKLRTIKEEGEEYAKIMRIFGAENAEVLCNDGIMRLCVIRKKFRGRRKKSNELKPLGFVLVGIRTWEVVSPKKKPKCDLLYVYGKGEFDELKQHLNEALVGEIKSDIEFNDTSDVNVDDI
mgnify:FL=1